jgi:undecaprenyl diphosphate synthase
MPFKTALSRQEPTIDLARLPRHVAIIMDGNGRWAKSKGLPRVAGHRAGVESVREAVRTCAKLGIANLTLFSFSTENWLRPKEEVSELMKLLCRALEKESLDLDKNNVRLEVFGRIEGLPAAVQQAIIRSKEILKDNTGLQLNLALNYGARQEITDAVNRLLDSGARRVTEDDIAKSLYTAATPDPDLLIRTSGELRVSNFMLWQIAYAELYVTPVFWPQFRQEDLMTAIAEFQKRKRRFGGL